MKEEIGDIKNLKLWGKSFSLNSILRLLLFVLLFTILSFLIWQFFQNKKISQGLQGVYVTDITDRSAVVSWVTSQPNKTELVYSNEEIKSLLNIFNSQTEYDRRDLEEIGEFEYKLKKRGNYYVHSVHLRNLIPQTEYYFAIRNGLFLNSTQYINTFSTTKEREEVDTPEVAYGNVYNQEGELITDTLLIFELTNLDDSNKSQQFSYVMDGNTGWTVNLSNLMDRDFKEEYFKEEQTYLNMQIINASGEITKIFDDDMIKPAENISAYDNEYEKKESDVKGIMAVLIPGITPPSDPGERTCNCLNCTVSCPTGYESSCPSGWDCTSKTVTCTKKYRCSDGEESTCGTNSKTCYLPISIREEESEDEKSEVSNCEGNNLRDKSGNIVKCDYGCQDNGTNKDDFCKAKSQEVGCTKYTDMSSCRWSEDDCEWSFSTQKCFSNTIVRSCEGDNLREKDGTIFNCAYGCQDNGVNVNDICKPKPNDIPQEVDCTKYTDMSSCRWAEDDCEWSFAEQKCSTSDVAVLINCSSISNQSTCNSNDNCEYVGGRCVEVVIDNYFHWEADEKYCTGLRTAKGDLIPIGYGTDSIPTHQEEHKCSLDILASYVDMGNQIPGSSYDPATGKRVWKEGYKCEPGTYKPEGYGNNILITQPDGIQIRYAHLKKGDCNGAIVTGETGGYGIHLHVEVICSTPQECATCQGKTNPCRAIAGGCFSCNDAIKAQAIFGNDSLGTGLYRRSSPLFSLISKVRAQGVEPIDPAILIQDLELPDGQYTVKSATTSKTTDFVKTDDTHIVFFEDANDNGKLDAEETILSPYEAEVEFGVAFEKTADSFKLVLQEGYNLVSFPILFKDENEKEIKKASELIEYLNKQGTEITTITAYRGGKFLPYVIRDGVGFGDDFNILPGEGYFVLTHSSGEFIFTGTKVKDGLEVQLYQGWNLVNIYNSEVESYSGFDILKKMREQSVGADILSKWEDGMYTNIVSEESGEYGTDFNVYQSRGYFVRVSGESGSFTPN